MTLNIPNSSLISLILKLYNEHILLRGVDKNSRFSQNNPKEKKYI